MAQKEPQDLMADVHKIKEEFIELHNQVPELIRYVRTYLYVYICMCMCVYTHTITRVFLSLACMLCIFMVLALKYAYTGSN